MNDILRGSGAFKNAMNAFEEILRVGGNPFAFITVTSNNIHALKDFMKFLLKNGIFRIHLSLLNPIGRALDRSDLNCNNEEVQRIVTEFWYERFGLKLKQNKYDDFMNCGIGRFITVYPDGSVYPCHLLAFSEFCVGNVRDENLYSLFCHSKLLNRLREMDFCKMANRDESFLKLVNCSYHTCIGRFTQEAKVRERLNHYLKK